MTSLTTTRKRKSDHLGDREEDSDEDSVTRHLHTFHAKETKGTIAQIEDVNAKVRRVTKEAYSRGRASGRSELEEGQSESLEEFLSGDNLNRLKARFPNLDIQELPYIQDLQSCSSHDFIHLCSFLSVKVALPLQETLDKLSGVRNELEIMAAFANQTEIKSTAIATEDECTEEDFKDMMRGVHIDSPTPEQQVIEKHLTAPRKDTLPPPKKDILIPPNLHKFASFWNDTMEQTNINEEPTNTEISETVSHILGWNTQKKREYTFPSYAAVEKKTVQPILACLFRTLSLIGTAEETADEEDRNEQDVAVAAAVVQARQQEGAKYTLEPAVRSDVRRENYIPKVGSSGTKRFVDYEVNQLMAFNPYLLAQEMSLPVEAKNVIRGKKTPQETHMEAVKQCIGHLAKRTLVAFNLCGVGINLKSIALAITPVYLDVITMTLSGMETGDVSLDVEQSGMLPLVSEVALKKFVTKECDQTYLTDNASCPFPADNETVPIGMQELFRLVCSDDTDLGLQFFGGDLSAKASYHVHNQSTQVSPVKRQELHDVIGYGTHGIVYQGKEEENGGTKHDGFVVKSSVVGEVQYIERELRALRALNENPASRPPSIPVLKDFGSICYTIRGTTINVPALKFSPKGSPVNGKLNTEQLQCLYTDIQSALNFANERQVFHLDVCARNIIFDKSCDKFVLIDWSCSVSGHGKKVKGFRGSLAFAHREVHQKSNEKFWCPMPKHDNASLLFTICALSTGVPIPWQGFYERNPDEECFSDRREQTKKALNLTLGRKHKQGSTVFLDSVCPIHNFV